MIRLYLTQREYDALLEAQNGKCCVRGCGVTEGLIAEHSTPNALKPGKPDQLIRQHVIDADSVYRPSGVGSWPSSRLLDQLALRGPTLDQRRDDGRASQTGYRKTRRSVLRDLERQLMSIPLAPGTGIPPWLQRASA